MKIHAIGGYNEVGKNMTALEIGDDVILFDCGIFLPAVVGVEEKEKIPTEKGMRALGALPDDLYLEKHGLKDKVRAILISHAHLDHVGAVPYLAEKYEAEVVATPFTAEFLKVMMKDSNQRIKNKIISVNMNASYTIKGKNNYKVEFLNMTHSTIQSAMIAVHTPEGIVMYANDFKLDNSPVFGEPPNYHRMKELSKMGIKALIVDCLYSSDDRKTPSEKVAKTLLEDVFFTQNQESGMVVTTFSSHIARLKTITELGKRLGREVVFLGRSLGKYTQSANAVGKAPFMKDITMATYRKQREKILKRINSNKKDYLVVCTGHQGEPGSILDRLSRNQLPLKFGKDDHVIFSSKTIPTPINEVNKEDLIKRLKKNQARVFDNVHVSVLPDTEVIFNDSNGMKIKEIGKITEDEIKEIKVPSFDPKDLKIKWYDAQVIKHPYNGKIFNIETKSGRNVSITSGHSLFKLEKGQLLAEKGDNLKTGDFLAIPKKFSWYRELGEINIEDYMSVNNNHFAKENNLLFYNKKPITNLKIKLTNEFARLLGYYLAEGSAPRHLSLVIAKHEEDILKEIISSVNKCFPSNCKVIDKGTSYEIIFGARILRSIFKKWFGINAKTKKVPKFVFSANNEFKLKFLGAYINGDGCIDKGKDHFRIRMKTASKKLASDLLYLCSQLGICAKFDHIEVGKRRKIAGNNKYTEETYAYVIRIQGIDYLLALKDYLSDKFRIQIESKAKSTKFSQQFPPEAFPIEKLNFDDIEPKKETYLYNIKYHNLKRKKQNISQKLILEQSNKINGFTSKVIHGDLLFDPIVKIVSSDYTGVVYDFTVPGVENFIGGFGGIMLHNSGHGGQEDLRDLIKITSPEHVIPSHGDLKKTTPGANIAEEMGYILNKTVHLMNNGKFIQI